jgi:ACR3 family arsenite efflux pump ArsB
MNFVAFFSQFLTFASFVQILTLLGVAFWIWMLIDCLRNNALEGINKIIWLLIILFIQPMIGALVYYAIGRSHQKKLPRQTREISQGYSQRSQREPQPKDLYPEWPNQQS